MRPANWLIQCLLDWMDRCVSRIEFSDFKFQIYKIKIMLWVTFALMSALCLGFYDIFKKIS